jgi:hypothetical protein
MLAYLSAPLVLDGDEPLVLGAVNLAGTAPNAFDPLDEALLTVFTRRFRCRSSCPRAGRCAPSAGSPG